jgi:hypothetical protein
LLDKTGIGALTTIVVVTAFWGDTGPVYTAKHTDPSSNIKGRTLKVIKTKVIQIFTRINNLRN